MGYHLPVAISEAILAQACGEEMCKIDRDLVEKIWNCEIEDDEDELDDLVETYNLTREH